MKKKIPIWVLYLVVIAIAGAGVIQDHFVESEAVQRADSLQMVIDDTNDRYILIEKLYE